MDLFYFRVRVALLGGRFSRVVQLGIMASVLANPLHLALFELVGLGCLKFFKILIL